MRVRIPAVLRYTTIHQLEFNSSRIVGFLFRLGLFFALVLAFAPWQTIKELVFGKAERAKSRMFAARAVFWIWNRSWIPIKFHLGTYFDIGWVLGDRGCKRLLKRGFVSKSELFRPVDQAQLTLASLRRCIEKGDSQGISKYDEKMVAFVHTALEKARAMSHSLGENSTKPEKNGAANHTAASSFDNESTELAFLEFNSMCELHNQPYFLVSGTFLGAVRHGRPLPHDHDIDLGVFSHDFRQDFIDQLEQSENFIVTSSEHVYSRIKSEAGIQYEKSELPVVIRVLHKTGVVFDLFIHFVEDQVVWHGTTHQRWDNSVFDLSGYPFLNLKCDAPRDFEQYFTENYGADWRIPKTDYDTNLDTPNMRSNNSPDAMVFWAWLVARVAATQDSIKLQKYLELNEKLS